MVVKQRVNTEARSSAGRAARRQATGRAKPDVAETGGMEEVLKESEELSRGLIEAATVGTYIVQDGAFQYVNPEYAHVSGYSADELVGTRSLDYVHPDDRDYVREKAIEHLKGYSRTPYEFRLVRKNGDISWVLERVAPIQYKGRRAAVGSFIDISERKRVEGVLIEREQNYKAIFESTLDGLFVIDAETLTVAFGNQAAVTMFGFESVDDAIGVNPLDFVAPEDQERAARIILEDMFDRDLRQVNEFRTISRGGREMWVSALGTRTEYQGRTVGLVSIRDITERKRAERAFQDSYERLERMVGQTVNALASVVELHDSSMAGHQRRVAQLAGAIASEMGLLDDQVKGVYMAGLVHDVGTVYVPSEVLAKPGRLSEVEYDRVKSHPRASYDILKTIEFPWPVAEMVFQHRERMDGSGYPLGLSGDDILLEARILGLADVVDAMTSDRPYRPALGLSEALAEVSRNRGTLYDSTVVDTCLKLFNEKRFSFDLTGSVSAFD